MKSKPYHHGDLRRALLDVALALLGEGGAQALTLRAIAQRAGVSHTAPYRHFADRETLLAALAAEGFRELSEALLKPRSRSPVKRLEASGRAYVRFALARPEHYRLMFGSSLFGRIEQHPALAEAASGAYLILVEQIRAGQVVGAFRSGVPEQLAMVAWSTVHGLAGLLIDGLLPAQGKDLEQLLTTATSAVRRGLSPTD